MIRELIHGGKDDALLFGLVGPIAFRKAVHDELASAVTSEPDDIWFINVDSGGECDGFAQMRMAKNGSAHVRYVFSDNSAVRMSLIKAAVASAKKLKASLIYTNDRKAAMEWSREEFKKQPSKRPGEFVRWEKEL